MPDEAQRLHEQRQHADPAHDRVSCWCCCLDCDFDFIAVTEEENG
jgi:hypothetical protein